MADNLIEYALNGYLAESDPPCPHYYSSPAGIAWMAGRWIYKTGRARPAGKVTMSRGYSIRVNGAVLIWRINEGDDFIPVS